MNDCLFCRIARREIPAEVVHDEARVMAFRDIHPQAPTHLLIIPKKHVARLTDLSDADAALVADLHRVARVLAAAVDPGARGFRLVVNNGADAGQAVDHLHYHFLAGRGLGWPPG